MYASELSRAKRRGDTALCWKLSRLLASNSLGPKQRNLRAPQARLEKETWKTFLEAPGREGGLLAKSPCQAEEQQCRQNREPKADLTISIIQHGTDDYIE
eukprot:232655-Pyramimonas_sp.AAC.1